MAPIIALTRCFHCRITPALVVFEVYLSVSMILFVCGWLVGGEQEGRREGAEEKDDDTGEEDVMFAVSTSPVFDAGMSAVTSLCCVQCFAFRFLLVLTHVFSSQ